MQNLELKSVKGEMILLHARNDHKKNQILSIVASNESI